MDATCMDGGSWPSSSRGTYNHHERMGMGSTTRSSRSGTIVSTAYTSGASRPSLSMDFELKIYEDLSWGERIEEQDLEKKVYEQERMKRVIELVNGGVKGWFTKLEVAWVLDLHNHQFQLLFFSLHAPAWIHALAEIVETIRFTQALPLPEEQAIPNQFFFRRVTSKILQTAKSKLLFFTNEVVTDDRASILDQIQFAKFTQVAMLKLLAVVDALVAEDFGQEYTSVDYANCKTYSYHTSLNQLVGVHGALSKALHVIDVLFSSSPQGEVRRILGEIFHLLSTKEDKALDAIWLKLKDCTTHVLKRIQDSSAIQTLQGGSSDIHLVTRTVINHISFVVNNKSSLDLLISEANNRGKVSVYESLLGNPKHFNSMMIIRIMASRLQEELASLSETCPDQGLRFLFLLNNSHKLHQCLLSESGGPSVQHYAESLFTKVDGYIQSYLQVSWAPVSSCLFKPTKRVLGKIYSPLTRFEFRFRQTYITQKHWKVPDPDVRKNLRTTIIEQIIPGYTKYIEENNITTPRLAPQELEEMLQDLFEG